MEVTRARYAESIRFVLVGVINTVLGYGLFVLLELTIGSHFGYLVNLYLSYAVSIAVAFALHRRFTFRVRGTGNLLIDFVRFVGVYMVSLLANTILLPILVEIAGLTPLVAQAIIVVVMTISTYFGHKFFSFRRVPEPEEVTSKR